MVLGGGQHDNMSLHTKNPSNMVIDSIVLLTKELKVIKYFSLWYNLWNTNKGIVLLSK